MAEMSRLFRCGSAQSGWMRVVVDTNVLVSGLLSTVRIAVA